jgi:predicted dienelactone hydrolase
MVTWVFKGLAVALGVVVIFALGVWALTLPPPRPETLPGHQTLTLTPPHRDIPMTLHLWYPAEQNGSPTVIGHNTLFLGTWAGEGATPLPGPHPLILISQDDGWSVERLVWLASRLVEFGFAVAMPTHAGADRSDIKTALPDVVAGRARDLSASLDLLRTNPPGGLTIDPAKVDALGTGLGGLTILALAGAHLSEAAAAEYCMVHLRTEETKEECQGVVIRDIDLLPPSETTQSPNLADPRIRRFIAANPTLPAALDNNSLRHITRRVMIFDLRGVTEIFALLGLGQPRPLRAVAAAIPKGGYETPAGVDTGSFRPECTSLAKIVTRVLAMHALCRDYYGRLRRSADLALAVTVGATFRIDDAEANEKFNQFLEPVEPTKRSLFSD